MSTVLRVIRTLASAAGCIGAYSTGVLLMGGGYISSPYVALAVWFGGAAIATIATISLDDRQ